MILEEEIKKAKYVIVDFFATWCGPCKMLAPVLDEVKEHYGDELYIIRVDVDKEAELADKFNVYSIPTLVLFVDGKVVDETLGYQEKEDLIAWIESKK